MARTKFIRNPEIKRLRAERERKKQEQNAKECRGIAEYALKHFNRTNKGTEYELLSDFPNVTTVKRGQMNFEHVNFLAKPRGAAEDETRLFFAELKVFTRKPFRVTCCRVLGPEGVVTGAQGCRTCSIGGRLPEDKTLQHPVDGGFTRGLHLPSGF